MLSRFTYSLILLKRVIESVIMFPFIMLGRFLALCKPMKEKEFDIVFFFPFYQVGGAEKVHSDIIRQFPDKKIMIWFTRKSVNQAFLHAFSGPNVTSKDISKHTDNKWLYFLNIVYRGMISSYINSQPVSPVVFNGQSNFGYKISPHIKKAIRQIELIHSFCSFSYIRIPFIRFYYATVMISHAAIRDHLELYKRFGIPEKYEEKIKLIPNGIKLPHSKIPLQPASGFLKILYVGRGDTVFKRVDLIIRLAKQLYENGIPAQISFMGEVEPVIDSELRQYGIFLGEQVDEKTIDDIYRDHQVLILLSASEGFPMVVMEAMARGLAVIATKVGDIPYHVKDKVNGLTIDYPLPDQEILATAQMHIKTLISDKQLLKKMQENNIEYAKDQFGMEDFGKTYRSLLLQ